MESIDFLLHSAEPWVVCRTMLDLIGLDETDIEVQKVKRHMLESPMVKRLIEEVNQWPGTVISSHKSAGQLYHKLAFLADLGIKKEDADFSELIKNITKHRSEEGLFLLPVNIPVHYGGTGQEQWAWALCDAPLLVYSVTKMGMMDKDEIKEGLEFLVNLCRDNGWPCAVSKELGKFRGPGKKDDPCPYTNLIMLKMMAIFEGYKDSKEAHIGAECLLNLWEKSKEQHPYMFFMGTDFRKLKAPFIWYDILHVADVLSQYEFVLEDKRFMEMLRIINSKADKEGLFTPESIWTAWKEWDFGQKMTPSPWMAFIICRINKRVNGN